MSRKSLYSLYFAYANDLLNMSIVIVIFAPMLMGKSAIFLKHASLASKTTHLGLLLAMFPLAQFVTAPFFGTLSDVLGRKKTLIAALIGCFIFNVLAAISILITNLPLLYISRFFSGAFAGNAPLAQAAIADRSDIENKIKNLSVLGILGSVAWIVGSPLGGILSNPKVISWFDFAVPLWFSAILFLINTIWLHFSFEETFKNHTKEKITFRSQMRDFIKVFHIPSIRVPLLTLFTYYLGWMMFVYFFPAVFVYRFDFSQSEIGYIAAYTAVCFSIGSFLSKKISMKTEKMLLVPFLICGICVLFSGFLPIFWPYMLIFLFACSTSAIVWIAYLSVISNLVGPENQGKAFGVEASLLSIATVLAPFIAGLLASTYIGLPFILAGIILLLTLGLYFCFFYLPFSKQK